MRQGDKVKRDDKQKTLILLNADDTKSMWVLKYVSLVALIKKKVQFECGHSRKKSDQRYNYYFSNIVL